MTNSLTITQDISENQIKQLIEFSNNDELIQITTSDAIRFKDRKAFDNWFKKKRQIFVLSDNTKKLLGIIWFGEKLIPDNITFAKTFNKDLYGITFAIRIYKELRGKGFSKMFLNTALEKYKESSQFKKIKNNKIWLETSEDNLRAVNAYIKAGFEKVSNADKNKKIIMVMHQS